jgi:mannose-6-phosphate isomerase-like protein (cupin superfamily)
MTDIVHDLKTTPDEVELPEQPVRDMQIVNYKLPSEVGPKVIVPIARSDIMYCSVQVLREGGANNLHSHTGMDGLWFVLKGRMRFYDKDGLVGEFGQHEGVFVPRNVPYWFESVGDEPLELLQAESIDRRGKNKRIDFGKRTAMMSSVQVVKSGTAAAE